MEKKLTDFKGTRIEVICGAGLVFRGVLESVNDDYIEIVEDEDDRTILSVDKVIAVRRSLDASSRPGFIS